jgi:hypothetical protein
MPLVMRQTQAGAPGSFKRLKTILERGSHELKGLDDQRRDYLVESSFADPGLGTESSHQLAQDVFERLFAFAG